MQHNDSVQHRVTVLVEFRKVKAVVVELLQEWIETPRHSSCQTGFTKRIVFLRLVRHNPINHCGMDIEPIIRVDSEIISYTACRNDVCVISIVVIGGTIPQDFNQFSIRHWSIQMIRKAHQQHEWLHKARSRHEFP